MSHNSDNGGSWPTEHPVPLRAGLAALLLSMILTVQPAQAQLAFTPGAKVAASWVSTAPTHSENLPDPRQNLTYSFIQQVTYETTDSNVTLGLEVIEQGTAFADVQLRVEHVNFSSILSLGGGGTPGTSAGPQYFATTEGPYPILTDISNMQATANIRVTVTLASKYALSDGRSFLFRYTLSGGAAPALGAAKAHYF